MKKSLPKCIRNSLILLGVGVALSSGSFWGYSLLSKNVDIQGRVVGSCVPKSTPNQKIGNHTLDEMLHMSHQNHAIDSLEEGQLYLVKNKGYESWIPNIFEFNVDEYLIVKTPKTMAMEFMQGDNLSLRMKRNFVSDSFRCISEGKFGKDVILEYNLKQHDLNSWCRYF
jgi:hypothetical protein